MQSLLFHQKVFSTYRKVCESVYPPDSHPRDLVLHWYRSYKSLFQKNLPPGVDYPLSCESESESVPTTHFSYSYGLIWEPHDLRLPWDKFL
jgi:hypothetical protein